MKKVPNSPSGASRRAYSFAYSKSSTDRVHDTLKGMKLSTPAVKKPKPPKAKTPNYSKASGDGMNVSFGATGDETGDYYG